MRTAAQQPRSDDGSIAPLVPIVILVMLILGGLVVDGARDLTARGDAQGYAEEAARAGAAGIDQTNAKLALDTSTDAGSVSTLVDAYCATVMASNPLVLSCGLATPKYTNAPDGPDTPDGCDALVVQPLVVHTVVTMKIETTLLGIVGVSTLGATGTGEARPYQGTNVHNAC